MSQYGLLGAFLGLVIGVIDYALLSRLLYPWLRNKHETAKLTQQHKVDPRYIMEAVRLVCFFIFPVVGFYAGRQFG